MNKTNKMKHIVKEKFHNMRYWLIMVKAYNCFEMWRVREEVERGYFLNYIAVFSEKFKVSRERRWIAGDIDNALGAEFENNRERFTGYAAARRIDNKSIRFLHRTIFKEVFGGHCLE